MAGFYPQIDPRGLTALVSIKQMLESDPTYLDSEDCSYDESLRLQLKAMLSPKIIEVPVEKIVERVIERKVEVAAAAAEGGGRRGPKQGISGNPAGNAGVISKELQGITQDLRDLKLNSKTLQPADKVAILKTQAALVEKMIVMEERATNIKRVSMFMSIVMGILDDVMNDDQRQVVMKRLEPFASEE